jgi:spore coat polysaccharide biosynthesis predicted glycosyltransferase SpsG
MNIGICLSGSIRKIEHSLETIEDISKLGNVKLFIHTWEFENEDNLKNQKVTQQENFGINFLLKNFKFESILVDKYESKLHIFKKLKQDNLIRVVQYPQAINHWPMHYSIKQANDLKIKYEKENSLVFDTVYRIRFDSKILTKENLHREIIPSNTIIIPNVDRDHSGINNQFAYGSSDGMDKYSNLFNNLDSLHGEFWNPEQLLLRYILSQNVNIHRSNLNVQIHY